MTTSTKPPLNNKPEVMRASGTEDQSANFSFPRKLWSVRWTHKMPVLIEVA
jgi:hypothetical protein